MNDPAESGELPASILDRYPGNPRYLWITGRLHVQLERRNAAGHTVSEARRTGNRRMEAEGLLTLSDTWLDLTDGWRERSDAPEAANFAREAAAIFHELHDGVGEAQAYCAQGKAWRAAGFNDELNDADPEQSATCYNQALAYWQAAKRLAGAASEREIQAQALEGIGSVLVNLRRDAEAVEELRHSIDLFGDAGNTCGSGIANSTLGLALLRLQRYDEAANACCEAIRLCGSAGELHSKRTAQVNLSYALLGADRYQESIPASRDALAACEEIDYADGVTSMQANLGFACLRAGQFEESLRWHKHLLEHLQDHTQRARATHHIGTALVALGDVAAGARSYKDAADEYIAAGEKRNAGIAHLDASEALLDAKRYQASIEASDRAATLLAEAGDGAKEARARIRLGQAYGNLERWEEAIEAFQEASSVSEQCGDRAQMALAETMIGGSLVDAGQPGSALPHLRWAIEEGDRIRDARAETRGPVPPYRAIEACAGPVATPSFGVGQRPAWHLFRGALRYDCRIRPRSPRRLQTPVCRYAHPDTGRTVTVPATAKEDGVCQVNGPVLHSVVADSDVRAGGTKWQARVAAVRTPSQACPGLQFLIGGPSDPGGSSVRAAIGGTFGCY